MLPYARPYASLGTHSGTTASVMVGITASDIDSNVSGTNGVILGKKNREGEEEERVITRYQKYKIISIIKNPKI